MRTKYSGLLKGLLVAMVVLGLCGEGEANRLPPGADGPGQGSGNKGPKASIQIFLSGKGAVWPATELAEFSSLLNTDLDNCRRGVIGTVGQVDLVDSPKKNPYGTAQIDVFMAGAPQCADTLTARVTWVFPDKPRDVMQTVVLTGDIKRAPKSEHPDFSYYSGDVFETSPRMHGNPYFARLQNIAIAVNGTGGKR